MNKMEEHWIYRFRPYTPLTLKELIYHEIYFSNKDELNDPLDLEYNFLIKKGDIYIHEYFLRAAFKSPAMNSLCKNLLVEKSNFISYVSKIFSKHDVIFDDLLFELDKDSIKKKYIEHHLSENTFQMFYNSYINILYNLSPKNLKTISFSRDYNNPLLWTHYANAHKGFCLIFSPNKNTLRLKNIFNNSYDSYSLENVEYDKNINIDVSIMFNENKKDISYENVNKYLLPKIQKKAILTKHPSHSKEEEIRVHGNYSYSFSALQNDEIIESSVERIYYYDPSQLTGIILGYKLNESQINEINKILEFKKSLKQFKIFQALKNNNSISIVCKKVF